ncbi:hypothetical protein A2U01_0097802, partial [Trifolium medium]|nr:hypothetical protein [Trifolium medium]
MTAGNLFPVKSGIAFGAHRWVATLKRHCESLA